MTANGAAAPLPPSLPSSSSPTSLDVPPPSNKAPACAKPIAQPFNAHAPKKRAGVLRKLGGRCGGAMGGSRLFLLQAVAVWSVLCLPGNLVTLVLHFKSRSAGTSVPHAGGNVSQFQNLSEIGGPVPVEPFDSPFEAANKEIKSSMKSDAKCRHFVVECLLFPLVNTSLRFLGPLL